MAALSEDIGVVKVLGPDGQISLGEEFAGKLVLVKEREPGVWLIRAETVTPENERWLLDPGNLASLNRAIAWEQTHPPDSSNTDELLAKWSAEFEGE